MSCVDSTAPLNYRIGSNNQHEMLFTLLTTIQEPTASVRELVSFLNQTDSKLIVVGDKKGPASFDIEGVRFLPLDAQLGLDLELSSKLPTGHYARKNVGYLVAIAEGAPCIYETDDDNAPLSSWRPRSETVKALPIDVHGWVNVFRAFTSLLIWPRGFPLDEIKESFHYAPRVSDAVTVRAPIQQGLANNSPDVDAIWRLVLDAEFTYESSESVLLRRGAWCPFNSQSTWWFPIAYPLMYLPSSCTFRMTDIWRSFIAQRCLWELDLGVVFHGAEVAQERNQHDLMRDFADEVPGYTRNKELVGILEKLSLSTGRDAVGTNLLRCYESLVDAAFFAQSELGLVNAWLSDLKRLGQPTNNDQAGVASLAEKT